MNLAGTSNYCNAYSFPQSKPHAPLTLAETPSTHCPCSLHLRRQSDEEIALARMLDKIFRRSDTIDREALCIIAGERVRPSHPHSYFLTHPSLPARLTPDPSRAPGLAPPHRNPRTRRRRRPPRLRKSSLRRRTPSFPSRRRRSTRRERRDRPPTRLARSRPSSTTPHALLHNIRLLPRCPFRPVNVKNIRSRRNEGG
jgi:hypothetical protein